MKFLRFSVVTILISFIVSSECCKVNGKEYLNGDEWIEKNTFVKKCIIDQDTSWHTEIVGCVTPKGAKVMAGKKAVEGDTEYSCVLMGPGFVFMDKHTVSANKPG
uniref:Abnormal cell migration protein 18-like fibronectin type I domain-containing protein n=1 Tax=Plectus sambesii TaxID=2011161 RepID=A0A914W0B4_9BILA